MSDDMKEVTCSRCGHTWDVDLSRLDRRDQEIYRDAVQRKSYRVRCPRCGTRVVIEVEVREEEGG